MALTVAAGNDYFYTDQYKVVVRSCKEILIARARFIPIMSNSLKHAYQHNFHKFLREFGAGQALTDIPEDMIWTISFINGMEDPTSGFSTMEGILYVTKEDVLAITQVARVIRE